MAPRCVVWGCGFFICLLLFFFLRATPMACGSSPGQGLNWSCKCWPTLQQQQHQLRVASATCTTACSNARSVTHWVRSGIKPLSSEILVGLIMLSHNGNSGAVVLITHTSRPWKDGTGLRSLSCLCIWDQVCLVVKLSAALWEVQQPPWPQSTQMPVATLPQPSHHNQKNVSNSWQHSLKEARHGNSLNVHRQMNGLKSCIYTVKCYSANKKQIPFTATWLQLESLILSKSEREKQIWYDITYGI